jgi:colanic acid/amylovoran biosynthesis protein
MPRDDGRTAAGITHDAATAWRRVDHRAPAPVTRGRNVRRIVVDVGSFNCRNMGDVAMLQVALTRLGAIWPAATLQVMTDVPEVLATHCPTAVPLPAAARRIWFEPGFLLGRVHRVLSARQAHWLEWSKRLLRRTAPSLLAAAIRGRMQLRGATTQESTHTTQELTRLLDAIEHADLVVACGQGGLTDHAVWHAIAMLDIADMAMRLGTPVAFLGQGIGPMRNSHLRAVAKDILPRIPLIALREQRGGLPLLHALGVDSSHVMVTGDDAIELAYEARPAMPGSAIGVNLRVAASAATDASLIDQLRPIVQARASAYRAALLPIPIARSGPTPDAAAIRELLVGYGDPTDGGEQLDTPRQVIEQAGRCRIVVTGAYHAAVFALAQGIPTVCLARSAYFADKMLGLAQQFGDGCEVVSLDEPDLPARLGHAIDTAWAAASRVREPLLDAAVRQIRASHDAYERLHELAHASTAARGSRGGRHARTA